MLTEQIVWHQLPADGMPDADITVMMDLGDAASDPVWDGWWDGERWRDAASGAPLDVAPLAWADKPGGTRSLATGGR